MLSRLFFGFSVGVGAFVIGLSQISAFFSKIGHTEVQMGTGPDPRRRKRHQLAWHTKLVENALWKTP